MRKAAELKDSGSCLNTAADNELVFVLLGRDAAAPDAIRRWATKRIALGLNSTNDEQIAQAISCAEMMDYERAELRKRLGKQP